jgi:hypothetical protein
MLDTLAEILKQGGLLVEPSELEERITVCDNCTHSEKGAFGTTCSICGCLMVLKARFAASECPLKKWPIRVSN